ncbi:DUF5926 family protein [Buchananella hordeovulneris]|uniref:DUF5926 family protein n=1 Tax=Buchananella hordeovulneris TaxID=52770 RepID=UPI000F5F301A|nr:DUF5926 family protein [Buchananella hordeovulneris]RRD42852.1 topoisomerase II [Buchananella hordeovulneris]
MGKKNRKDGAPKRQRVKYVDRPFEGLGGEADLVAMRELLPCASARVRTTAEYGGREVLLVTVLPNMSPVMVRKDGVLVVGMQIQAKSGDASRDYAAAILAGLELEPGQALGTLGIVEPGPRLQDVLDPAVPVSAEIHPNFEFWLDADTERTEEVTAALEESAQGMVPSAAVADAPGAFWCSMNNEFLRWVRSEDEDDVWDALARLHAAGESHLGEGTRFVGAFRTCGLLVPVWELAPGTGAEGVTAPAHALGERLAAALAAGADLDDAQRRARAGLVSRQVTLR